MHEGWNLQRALPHIPELGETILHRVFGAGVIFGQPFHVAAAGYTIYDAAVRGPLVVVSVVFSASLVEGGDCALVCGCRSRLHKGIMPLDESNPRSFPSMFRAVIPLTKPRLLSYID